MNTTKKIIYQLSNERLITPSGLPLVGAILGKSALVKLCNSRKTNRRSSPQINNGDILLTYIGLLVQGKTSFDDVHEMYDDPDYYMKALGIQRRIPSAEALRQRMDGFGTSLRKDILDANVSMFNSYGIKPTPLDNGYVPIDIDVTPFDNSKTKKEGVSRTYKGCDGYAPVMAYIGSEGFLVNTELREGKQHCQNGTPEFLIETLPLCRRMTIEPILVRMDAGNDAAVNIGILHENNVSFIIKRNPRNSETAEEWMDLAKYHNIEPSTPRDGKTVYLGTVDKEVEYKDANNDIKTVKTRIVYEVIERIYDRNGQLYMKPDLELNTWWTNVPSSTLSNEEVRQLYHAHGECEQYHSEIKTDMDVERLPSGKFDTNALVLELTILAYNILRMMGQESLKYSDGRKLKRPVRRRRLRTVISNLISIAGHLVEHGRRTFLSLGKSNTWRHVFMRLVQRFAT